MNGVKAEDEVRRDIRARGTRIPQAQNRAGEGLKGEGGRAQSV